MCTLSVTTRDRPEILTDSLHSVIAATDGQHDPPELVVYDDAQAKASAKHTQDIVSAASQLKSVVITYHGRSERLQMATELATSREIQNSVRFSNLPYTESPLPGLGRNRNAAVLRSAGKQLISVDDDALFSFSTLQVASGSQIQSHGSHLTAGEAILADSPNMFRDAFISAPFANHRDLDVSLRPVHYNVYEAMLQELDGPRIPVVMTGVRGVRWYERPAHIFHATHPLRDLCFRPHQQYRQNRLSGYAVFHAARPVLSSNRLHITCCSSYDLTTLLPPCPPLGRNEDSVFGFLVRYCYPDSRTLHLPVAVDHVLSPPRPMPAAEFLDTTLRFGDLTYLTLAYLAHASPPQSTDPATRLQHLGTRLMELSQASHNDWLDLSHELTIAAATREVESLEELKDRHNNEPRWWARDVDEYIERLIAQSADPLSAIPRELRRAGYDAEQATEFHRTFCHKYGNLMIHWPEIFERARAANLTRA